ncbi:MAG: hypothetical protein LBV68_00325 [Spirochaetaceae bacterium]|nr:hypothetical protein [Spirochaetaceae bacterium]
MQLAALVSGLIVVAAVMFIGYRIVAPDDPLNIIPTPEHGVIKDVNAEDLSVKFGITSTGPTKVTDTLIELHAYLGKTPDATDIKLGDYMVLPSLSVTQDTDNQGAISGLSNVRVLVVGINSFNGKNGNNTPHLVFQFKDALVDRTMGVAAAPYSYIDSGIQTYLKGNFVSGLENAGVLSAYLWAPSRAIAEKYNSTSATIIADTVWLPTEWEIFGANTFSVSAAETVANQAKLEYYTTADTRKKGLSATPSTPTYYWLASPLAGTITGAGDIACTVSGSGDAFVEYTFAPAGGPLGFAPAFCVY